MITNVDKKTTFERGHPIYKLTYNIEDATKKDEGEYRCDFNTSVVNLTSTMLRLNVDGEYCSLGLLHNTGNTLKQWLPNFSK